VTIARAVLLRASRSRFLADQLGRRRFIRRAVRRFMPGEELGAALEAAGRFASRGIGTVFTQLGENVTTRGEAEAVLDHYLGLLDRLRARALPAQVSVKLTHLGLDIDADACERAVRALAERAADAGSFVWIDMEDSSYTDRTVALYERLRPSHPSLGLCLQAYLRRTAADLDRLAALVPAVRLVKGAYGPAALVRVSPPVRDPRAPAARPRPRGRARARAHQLRDGMVRLVRATPGRTAGEHRLRAEKPALEPRRDAPGSGTRPGGARRHAHR
jgi:proline dehydrogenase